MQRFPIPLPPPDPGEASCGPHPALVLLTRLRAYASRTDDGGFIVWVPPGMCAIAGVLWLFRTELACITPMANQRIAFDITRDGETATVHGRPGESALDLFARNHGIRPADIRIETCCDA